MRTVTAVAAIGLSEPTDSTLALSGELKTKPRGEAEGDVDVWLWLTSFPLPRVPVKLNAAHLVCRVEQAQVKAHEDDQLTCTAGRKGSGVGAGLAVPSARRLWPSREHPMERPSLQLSILGTRARAAFLPREKRGKSRSTNTGGVKTQTSGR